MTSPRNTLEADRPAPANPPAPHIRLCVMATLDISIQNLFRGRLEYLMQRGFEITVVCGPTRIADEITARGVRLFVVPMGRWFSPWRDVQTVARLTRFLRRETFDLVEVSTPKAAFVGALAARLAGVRRVVHILHGLVYQSRRGIARRFLQNVAAAPCRMAHCNIAVSHSVREQAHRDRICDRSRMQVLDRGSCNGVDLERFHPRLREQPAAARDECGIPRDALVLGFVGRMVRDKGLIELIEAWKRLRDAHPSLHLLMVGDYEPRDRPPARVVRAIASDDRIHHLGWLKDPLRFYAAMDLLVLPSHREGLATVLLEAAAIGLPIVTTDAVGCRDAIDPGQTGLCVPIGDSAALHAALDTLIRDAGQRARMGAAGRRWVEAHFDQQRIWELYEQTYRRLLAATAG